jgi:hypothetical protein
MINNTADHMTSASDRRPCQVSPSLAPRCSRRGSRRGGGSVRGSGLLPPGGTAGSMGPCGPERGGGLESPIRHSGIPRRFSIRPSRQSICWSSSLSVGDSDIGSSRSSLGPETGMGSVALHPPRTQEKQKIRTVRTDGFGIREAHSALVTPSKHPSGRNPDSAPRPMCPPVTP